MNKIPENILKKANEEALYNVFMYLIHLCKAENCKTLNDALSSLKAKYTGLSPRDKSRYNILSEGIRFLPVIGQSEIRNTVTSPDGFTAATFIRPGGDVSVVFKGTGSGEWIDNGEGLSGIPETNTYITYAKGGKEIHRNTVTEDYATNSQVRALNYFSKSLSENLILKHSAVTVSGHSKGGNKAQFIAINSDIPLECYSFSGHGFSPEAAEHFKIAHGSSFESRCHNIVSISAENDYVNVLGRRIVPESNVYYLRSYGGFHFMESILSRKGILNSQSNQGILSAYVQSASDEIMNLKPDLRKHATVGIMRIFQKYVGNAPQSEAGMPAGQSVAAIAMALGAMLKSLRNQ